MTNSNRRQLARVRNAFLGATALAGFAAVATPASAVVINNNFTPTQAVDPNNVTGVGQLVVDLQNGTIGLCTATLINPRVVLFASHCVNENATDTAFKNATTYGAANGGTPIGFFFNSNNNAAGNSAIGQWLNGVSGGPRYQTRTANNAYNSNFVDYNTGSIQFGLGGNFFQSDVAIAALDTPATAIPSWTLLFSPLSAPVHATIEGYGTNGVGSTGATGGIDFRRRVAENIVSMLGSLADIDAATGFPGDPQPFQSNLYLTDFNNPNYKATNTQAQNQGDFNIFNDLATTREGITAPGDSGGPLVIDHAFASPTIAAVLSGGITFPGQVGGGYGTQSFYQPLYLYWDWIVANNPYKYVGAKAGNGLWTDPTHWQMNLDPAYVTIGANGQLVNALPTTPAAGGADIPPGFGEVCYYGDCVNITTPGVHTAPPPIPPNPTAGSDPAQVQFVSDVSIVSGSVFSDPAQVSAGTVSSDPATADDSVVTSDPATAPGGSFTASPDNANSNWTNPENSGTVGAQTIIGLPGTTLTTAPNDTNGNAATGAPPRYYDVTLAAAGITTLTGASITIDRLTINGPSAGLTISAGASLTSLIDTTIFAGTMQSDGNYTSVGDFALMGGVLTGSGTVTAPHLTAVLGAIAPGTPTTIGTLTVNGNLILSSGSGLLIDKSATAIDKLVVNGTLNAGGTVVLTPVNGYVPQQGDAAVFATATTITGVFGGAADTLPGVLMPSVSIVGNTAVVTIVAGSFVTVIGSGASAHQLQIAAALDADRGAHYNDMLALYQAIDPLSDGALAQALENLAPLSEEAATLVGDLQTTGYDNMLWQQLGGMGNGAAGYGQSAGLHIDSDGLKSALNSASGMSATSQQFMALGASIATNPGGGNDVIPTTGTAAAASPSPAGDSWMGLPNGAGGFISGSSLNGTVAIGGDGKADVRGLIIGAGVDFPVADGLTVGASIGFSDALATLRSAPASLQSNTFQGALYARYDFGNHYMAEAFGSYGGQTIESRRIAVVGPTSFAMMGHSSGSSPAFGASIGRSFVANTQGGMTINLIPSFGLQYTSSSIDAFTETGGPAAMTFAGFSENSLAARIGFDANATFDLFKMRVTPNTHLFWVNSFGNNGSIQAAFAAAPSGIMTFAIAARDHSYAETGFGLDFDLGEVLGKDATLSGRYDSTLARKDIGYGAWTGRLSIKF